MTEDEWLSQLRDKIAIEELLVRYCTAIDTKNFELLDSVFLPNATIDYRKSGGIRAQLPEIKAWLAEALRPFVQLQHMIGNVTANIDGDRARCVCYFYNPMGMPREEGGMTSFVCGGFYRDQLVRTDGGWRIAERVNDQQYMHSVTALQLPEVEKG